MYSSALAAELKAAYAMFCSVGTLSVVDFNKEVIPLAGPSVGL